MGREGNIDALVSLSRERALTRDESYRLSRALERQREPKGQKPWTRDEISRLQRYLKRGKKPAFIAIVLKRSERAVWRKIYKEGMRVGDLCPESVFTPSRARVQSRRER
jgi:hypothetical protein